MMRRVFVVLLGLMLNGCLMGGEAPGEEFLTELTCQQVAANANDALTCIPTDSGLLLQTQDVQITLRTELARITFDSTVYLWRDGRVLYITPLDGIASVSSNEESRVLSAGKRVELNIADDSLRTLGGVSEPVDVQTAEIANLPISNLPRTLNTVQTIQNPATEAPITATPAPPTATTNPNSIQPAPLGATPTPTPTEGDPTCNYPQNWTLVYSVQPGDTLTRISQEYDVPLADIVTNNCLENPDQLALGQELRLPVAGLDSPQEGATLPPNEGNSASFTAERDVIVIGDCVTLTWNATNAQSATLDEVPVPINGVQAVCPETTRGYALRVTHNDGQQMVYTVMITVTQ